MCLGPHPLDLHHLPQGRLLFFLLLRRHCCSCYCQNQRMRSEAAERDRQRQTVEGEGGVQVPALVVVEYGGGSGEDA